MTLSRAVVAVALLLAACDGSAAGTRAYREGRFDEAHRAYAAAADAAGAGASPEILYDRALAALRHGDLADADRSAAEAATRGGPEFAALRDFVRGNVAFARCLTAGLQASAPEAEPFAFDVAIAYGETARAAWQSAAASRADWPEASRNVERALVGLESLRRRKAEAEQKRQRQRERKPQPKPAPQERRPVSEEAPLAGPQNTEIPRTQVLGLLDRLAAKEKAKLESRRTQRGVQPPDVEQDW